MAETTNSKALTVEEVAREIEKALHSRAYLDPPTTLTDELAPILRRFGQSIRDEDVKIARSMECTADGYHACEHNEVIADTIESKKL